MSKDILALMMQGKESKTGTSHGSLLAKRDAANKTDETEGTNRTFNSEKTAKHRLLLITSADDQFINKLLYNVASFNFSRFMVKDFDLSVSKLDSVKKVLSVTNFETYDETDWYLNSLSNDTVLTNLINKSDVQKVIISENNFGLLKINYTLDDYLSYHKANISAKSEVTLAQNTVQKTIKKQEPEKTTKPAVAQKKTTSSPEAAAVPIKATVEKLDKEFAEKIQSTVSEKSTVPVPEKTGSNNQQSTITSQPSSQKVEQEEAPLFKNLFAYRPGEPHFVAVPILSGTINFDKTKAAIDTYNKSNYGIMNLKVSLEIIGKMQIMIIGSFADANIAKSYLIRMVKEKSLFENMGDANYRNLVGSQSNLNVMMQQNAIKTYIEFMQEYYLK
jgi:hypothetical protein